MAKQDRIKTSYPGVVFIVGQSLADPDKPERIYYIRYRKDGKAIEEKVGRQYVDDMTPARAARIRAARIQKDQLSNEERREEERSAKEAEASRWTIGKLWEEYKAQHALKGLAQDESRFRLYVGPHFSEKEPRELVSLDIDRLRIKLLKSKTPQTVKNILALLRRIIQFGCKKGLCKGPEFVIQMPTKINNLRTEDLSDEDMARLMEALDQDPDIQAANMMRLVLCTGMRRSELFRLKWEDIDFERSHIHLRAPKGGKDATIPLNASARAVLTNHPRTDASDFVFPGRGGKQRVEIRKAVNRIKKAAGLPDDFRPLHGLRHTFASMLASSGQVDLYTLQKLLTHKSPDMTQRYAHLRDDALRKASELAGSIVEQALENGTKEKEPADVVRIG
ncbi:MAG: tyrosine-type recombinase/integrase [Syntrophobacteraceae bacterium]